MPYIRRLHMVRSEQAAAAFSRPISEASRFTKFYQMGAVQVPALRGLVTEISENSMSPAMVITHNAAMADRVVYFADGLVARVERNEHKKNAAELRW